MAEKMCNGCKHPHNEDSIAMQIVKLYKRLFYTAVITGTVVTAILFGVILYLIK